MALSSFEELKHVVPTFEEESSFTNNNTSGTLVMTVRISAHGGVGRETGQVPCPHVPHVDVVHGVNENQLLGQDEANDVLPTNDGKDD